jgi:hypothetical protein
MVGSSASVSAQQLCDRIGTAAAPVLIDVRKDDAFASYDSLIIGPLRRPDDEPGSHTAVDAFMQTIAWKSADRLLSDIANNGGQPEIKKGAYDA